MSRIPDPYSYAFAVGKIRAKETLLLKEKDFQKLIDLDFNEALQFLSKNRSYGQKISSLDSIEEIEEFLKDKEEELVSLIESLIKEKDLFRIINGLIFSPQKLSQSLDLLSSEFLKNYFKHYIDLINIKRLFSLKEEKEFIKGGFIQEKLFKELENKDKEESIKFFKNTPYGDIVEKGFLYYKKEDSFLYLETLIKSFLIDFLKIQKYNPFGLEPVIAYYLAYLNELSLVRFILIGKLLGLKKEVLEKGLVKTYV
jgi:V/A-type H+-transporting ATPase subunit C